MTLVTEAASGREAIQQFRPHRPDVTLMDIQMPEMNGLDALIAIRTEFPDARVVVLTTYEGSVDAQTGVFMLVCLDLAYEKASREGRLRTLANLQATIVEGAAKRLRPKFMTMATTFIGLIPIMWATGTGSDVWKRIAAPMVGGIFTSFVLELVVYPAIYEIGSGTSR